MEVQGRGDECETVEPMETKKKQLTESCCLCLSACCGGRNQPFVLIKKLIKFAFFGEEVYTEGVSFGVYIWRSVCVCV